MALVSPNESIVNYLEPQLGRLRGRLRGWVAVRALGRWLALALLICALDMLVDRLFRLDFSQRLVLLVLMSATAIYFFYRWCLRPLSRAVSNEALIFELESQNPQLQQALIGGWQLEHDQRIAEKGWSLALAAESIRRSRQQVGQLDFGKVLNTSGLRNNLLILAAGVLLTAGLCWGIASHDFFRTWFRRNLMLTSDQWPQQTHLLVDGVVDGQLVIPRGADHRQLVTVAQQSALIPDQLTLEVDASGSRVFHTMKTTGRESGREHAFVFHSVASEFRFRAAGGDAETEWIQVKLVEPPALVQLDLQALPPPYTQIESQALEGVGPHTILQGSRLRIRAQANKPLKICQLHLDQTVFDLQALDSRRSEFALVIPSDDSAAGLGAPGGKYTFVLQDDSGLNHLRESSFSIRTRTDQPPSVRAQLLGISGLVVPRANLPVSMGISDDYGLADLSFDCRWILADQDAAPQVRSLDVARFALGESLREFDDVAVLKLESLPLVPDTSFRLVVVASDHQPQRGVGTSREFLLRVVSEEELRADLLRREIEQRRALQQSYDAQMNLISEVRQALAPAEDERSEVQRKADLQNKLLSLFRAQRAVGTGLATIASRFEEFLVEVRNNRLDEGLDELAMGRSLVTRFGNEIAAPLRIIDEEWVALAARNLEQCSRHLQDEVLLQQAADQTIAAQEEILNRIRQVMAAMEDSENYQDVVNRLMEFKRIEDEIKQQIKRLEDPNRIIDNDQ